MPSAVVPKNAEILFVALEAVDPYVPLGSVVTPSVSVFTWIFKPVFMLAVAVPVGAMDKLLLIVVPLAIVFANEPDRIRL